MVIKESEKSHTCYPRKLDCGYAIDLESSATFVELPNGQTYRPNNWEYIYANMAYNLNEQGFHVFLSSHKAVRDALCTEKFKDVRKVIICPSLDLKEKWIDRLTYRYEAFGLVKDYKALMNAKTMYDENIADLISESDRGFEVIEIKDTIYDLADIINSIA